MISTSILSNMYFAIVYGQGAYDSSLYSADAPSNANGSSNSNNTYANPGVTGAEPPVSSAEKQTNGAIAGKIYATNSEPTKNNGLDFGLIIFVFSIILLIILIIALWRARRKNKSARGSDISPN